MLRMKRGLVAIKRWRNNSEPSRRLSLKAPSATCAVPQHTPHASQLASSRRALCAYESVYREAAQKVALATRSGRQSSSRGKRSEGGSIRYDAVCS